MTPPLRFVAGAHNMGHTVGAHSICARAVRGGGNVPGRIWNPPLQCVFTAPRCTRSPQGRFSAGRRSARSCAQADPDNILIIEQKQMPGSEELEVGEKVYLSGPMGQRFPVKVTAKTDTTITFDANHEMAGKELNFKIELVSVG